MQPSGLDAVRGTFRAVAETIVPELAESDTDTWHALDQTVESVLAERDDTVRRQLKRFLRALDILSIISHRRRFARLTRQDRTALLERLGASRFVIIRRGVWGLKTLIFMGYYTQPAVQQALGYRAHRDGWRARRALQTQQ